MNPAGSAQQGNVRTIVDDEQAAGPLDPDDQRIRKGEERRTGFAFLAQLQNACTAGDKRFAQRNRINAATAAQPGVNDRIEEWL